jgi:Zn-dependent alcohol dehydrogenase
VSQAACVGTFSEYTVVSEWSCIKVPQSIPFASLSLLGCGVPTGWGSAVLAAGTKPGDTIVVIGVGGVGIHAVQGAVHAGATNIIAVDPVAMKRGVALRLGATAVVASMAEAGDLARSLTNGQGANAAVVTIGIVTSAHLSEAIGVIGKGGTVVLTGVGREDEMGIPVSLPALAMYQKRVQGALYGMMSPTRDVPRLIALYERGLLKLDELVTLYKFEDINRASSDMRGGTVMRGVIDFGL